MSMGVPFSLFMRIPIIFRLECEECFLHATLTPSPIHSFICVLLFEGADGCSDEGLSRRVCCACAPSRCLRVGPDVGKNKDNG
eukprot:m.18338 g.18338  ORF g.18338 m.18338 type:complete len:83 (-) comp8300_c0_seq1:195-443(-)